MRIIESWPGETFEAKKGGFAAFFEREGLPVHDLLSAENKEELSSIASDILDSEILKLRTEVTRREREITKGYRDIDQGVLDQVEELARDLIRKGIVEEYRDGDYREIDIAHALLEEDVPRGVAFLAAVRVAKEPVGLSGQKGGAPQRYKSIKNRR